MTDKNHKSAWDKIMSAYFMLISLYLAYLSRVHLQTNHLILQIKEKDPNHGCKISYILDPNLLHCMLTGSLINDVMTRSKGTLFVVARVWSISG